MFVLRRMSLFRLFLTVLLAASFSAIAWIGIASAGLDGIEGITVNGTSVIDENGSLVNNGVIFVNSNLADITVTAANASSITINKETAVEGNAKVFLKAGKNSIPITVTFEGENTELNLEIYYMWGAYPGSEYIISQYPLSGKVSVFDGDVELNFPKATFVATQSGGDLTPSSDQSIYFKISNTEPSDIDSSPISDEPGIDKGLRIGYYVSVLPYSMEDYSIQENPGDYCMSNNGYITLNYDDNIKGEAAKTLTIYYIPYGGSHWQNLGGVINTTSYTIKAPFKGFGHYVIMNMHRNFSDYDLYIVSGTSYKDVSWSKIYVEPLWARGIFGDIKTTTVEDKVYLGLAEDISRGELAEMLVLGMGLPLEELSDDDNDGKYDSVYFDDMDKSELTERMAECIETAAKYGLVRGKPDPVAESKGKTIFDYDGELTREEAATILTRALGLKIEDDLTKVEKQIMSAFKSDYSQISPWAWPYVCAVYKAKYMVGKGSGTFGPADKLTKAEAAKIIYLVMKNMGRI